MKGLDFQDRLDRMRGIKDFIILDAKNSDFRRYAKEITPSTKIIKDLFSYLGYGINVGKKRKPG